ncbi:MAG: OmpH family outer membrane protein [Desulfosudaceae bacterium]
MKKFIKTTIPSLMGMMGLILAAGLTANAADVAKIGVINFQQFLMESDIGKEAQAKIEKEGTKMESELKAQGDQIEELRGSMERDAMIMSDAKREEKMRDYRIKINDLKELQEKYKTSFRELEQRLIARIQEKSLSLAEDLGKKEGYLLLIERGAAIYYPEAIDVTDKLIEMANSRGLSLDDVQSGQNED